MQVVASGLYTNPRMTLAALASRGPDFIQHFFAKWIETLPFHKTFTDVKVSIIVRCSFWEGRGGNFR